MCERNLYSRVMRRKKMKSIRVNIPRLRLAEEVKLRWLDAAGCADKS